MPPKAYSLREHVLVRRPDMILVGVVVGFEMRHGVIFHQVITPDNATGCGYATGWFKGSELADIEDIGVLLAAQLSLAYGLAALVTPGFWDTSPTESEVARTG